MNPPPVYDQSALRNLAERTEYETWFLEAVYAIAEPSQWGLKGSVRTHASGAQ